MIRTTLLCYAPQDEQMAEKLKNHLSSLIHNELITLRGYGSIIPGSDREKEMDKYLKQAHIILLLISSNFLASRYCYRVQMEEAIKRHERKEARVIPIILRPVHWKKPPLDKLQALPRGDKPISQWKDRDEGYTDVAKGIERVIEQLNTQRLPDPIAMRRIMIAKLDRLIEAVKTQIQPAGRALAMASSLHQLQELSIFIPIDVTLADLMIGWRTLSQNSLPGDDPPTTQRRVTCGELANIASQFTTDQGNLAHAIKTWKVWRDLFQYRSTQNTDDPRLKAIVSRFTREFTELQEADR